MSAAVAAPSRLGVATACLGFAVMGATQSMYGPLTVRFMQTFHLRPAEAGLAISVQFLGGLIGAPLFYRLWRPLAARRCLALAFVLTAAGAAMLAVAPVWTAVLAAAALLGLGLGGVDFGLNLIFSGAGGARGAALINLLHAQFGLGSALGPLALAVMGEGRWRLTFALLAAAALVPLAGLGHLPRDASSDGAGAQAARARLSWPALAGFVALYTLHVALEADSGGWMAFHLRSLGHPAARATALTAGFWAALTVGRLLTAATGGRLAPHRIVLICAVGLLLSLAAACAPTLAPFAWPAAGLFVGPLFPTGLAWFAARGGGAGGTAALITVGALGGVVAPPALGWVIEARGASAAPATLAGLAVVYLILTALIARGDRARI